MTNDQDHSFENEEFDEETKKRAAEDLLESGKLDEETLPGFVAGLESSDKALQDVCARALTKFPENLRGKVAEAVVPLIARGDIESRNLAGEILSKSGNYGALALRSYLKHEDFDVRKFACDMLGNIGSAELLPDLYEALDDDDANVATSAIEAIGAAAVPESLPVLEEFYYKSEDLKPPVIEAVGKIGGKAAQDFLIDKLRNESDIFLQTACIDALALAGADLNIGEALIGEMRKAPEQLRPIILKTVAAIHHRMDAALRLPDELRDTARQAMFDDDPDIRAGGLIALGDQYEIGDIPALINETVRGSSDTRQIILMNLLLNSDPKTVDKFFGKYCATADPDGTQIEFLSYLPTFWNQSDEENTKAALKATLKSAIELPMGSPSLIAMQLYKLDADSTTDIIKSYLASESEKFALEALDVSEVIGSAIFRDQLEILASRKDPVGERAREILANRRGND